MKQIFKDTSEKFVNSKRLLKDEISLCIQLSIIFLLQLIESIKHKLFLSRVSLNMFLAKKYLMCNTSFKKVSNVSSWNKELLVIP